MVQGAVPALRENGRIVVYIADRPILVVFDGGRPHAVQALCSHRGAHLQEGCLVEGLLICPWHRSVFRLADGAIVGGPAQVPLRVIPVAFRDDDVIVG